MRGGWFAIRIVNPWTDLPTYVDVKTRTEKHLGFEFQINQKIPKLSLDCHNVQ